MEWNRHICDADNALKAGPDYQAAGKCCAQNGSMAQICLQSKLNLYEQRWITWFKFETAQTRCLWHLWRGEKKRNPCPRQVQHAYCSDTSCKTSPGDEYSPFPFHTPNHLMLYQDCWIQPNPRIVTCNKDAWPCRRRWQNLACWPGARVTALELMSLSNRFNNVQGGKKN